MFLEKLLSLMDRVYNWARMEKWRYSQYQNEDSLSNYYVYAHFVIIMLSGLIRVCLGNKKRLLVNYIVESINLFRSILSI